MRRNFSKLGRSQSSLLRGVFAPFGRRGRRPGAYHCDLLKLTLGLVILAAVFLPSGERAVTDLVETTAYASPDCASGGWEQGDDTAGLTAVYALASHSESANVYAGFWGDGVYRSVSGGNSWYLTPLGFPMNISSLAIDPANPAVVYAGTMENGVRRSENSGGYWGETTGLEGKEVWSLAVTSTADPVYAYAGTTIEAEGSQVGEIYISTDGTEWDLAGGTEIGTEKFYALAVDPQDSKIAYVGTKGKGVYRTADGGINWTPRGLDGKTVRALALHPDDSDIIYAGTQSPGIFKSTDGGNLWSSSELDEYGVLAIAINPGDPEFVYAGTWGGGVWVSDDGGHKWRRMPGLTDGASYVFSLTLFSPEGEDEGQVLYAGTTDGVWACTVTSAHVSYLPLVYKE